VRWRLEDGEDAQPALFRPDPGEVVERRPGQGAFRGMEFLHVRARTIINTLGSSALPFRHTINAYRGCSHACTYCLSADTPVLLANGRHAPIAELEVGDPVYGTEQQGRYRRYVPTPVLAHWSTTKPAYRVLLADGTELLASSDHRFLTDRGWKHVTGAEQGRGRRPHLTIGQSLLGTGGFATSPADSADYHRGYLCGIIRGDVPLADVESRRRVQSYLCGFGVRTPAFACSEDVEGIRALVSWPDQPSHDWSRGFLAGIFDAEGSYSRGILRIANTDDAIVERTMASLQRFAFDCTLEAAPDGACNLRYVRVRGGLREHLRLFHLADPAITRKRTIDGTALERDADLRIIAIEPLGTELPMFDITTGTGDFIANGVVSHNCFARPSHAWLELDIDEGFERQVVVKVNAVERLRCELAPRRWTGEPIAMGTNTDPYQRCEGIYGLTRALVEVLAELRNPFSVLTKSTLVLRDLELLAEASRRTDVTVNLSIGTLDTAVWRATEPGTPHPRQRVEAIARLRSAGVRCGVLVAPVLPGLSDGADQLDAVVAACTEAGASQISGGQVVYLKPGTREVFLAHLSRTHPELVERYEALYEGTYAPKEVRREVSRRLSRALERHGGHAVAITRNRSPRPAPRERREETSPAGRPTQLDLPW
jgi:DNA repair photolyase